MIVVEDRFEEMVLSLPHMSNPAITGDILHSVKFGSGDDKELMSYIIAHNTKVYPLIWLITPFNEIHVNKLVKLNKVSFILAVPNKDVYLNKERFRTTYKNVLIPLYNNFIECLRKSNIVNLAQEIEVIKYPNYSNEKLPGNRETLVTSEQNKTIDIWDAIKVTISCSVNDNCFRDNIKYRVNKINYNTLSFMVNAGWIYIDQCYVDKKDGNCDNFKIEIGDIVYYKDVTHENKTITIVGWEYTGGDKSLSSSYEKVKNLS